MTNKKSFPPSKLDVVALLADLPAAGLARGQVGTVVEMLGKDTALVEFSGDDGRAYAIVACPSPTFSCSITYRRRRPDGGAAAEDALGQNFARDHQENRRRRKLHPAGHDR